MYDTLTLLLMLALLCDAENGHDRKQHKKILLKLHKKVAPKLQTEILKPVLEASDIRKEIYHQIDVFTDILEVSQQTSEEGGAGILMIDRNRYYPIAIHLPDAFERCNGFVGAKYLKAAEQELLDDREWIIQNEMDIKDFIVKHCSADLEPNGTLYEIALFSNRGFTGIMTPFVLENKRGLIPVRRKPLNRRKGVAV